MIYKIGYNAKAMTIAINPSHGKKEEVLNYSVPLPSFAPITSVGSLGIAFLS
jgi:hypothetical protein